MPQAAPDKAASPMHSQADKLSSGHMAADDPPAVSARMTGQQSLQKATIALKGLQTKYGQASSTAQRRSSGFLGTSPEMLSGAADTEADTEADSSAVGSAAAPSRSSFSFDSPVGLREAASSSGGSHPRSLRGAESRSSARAHPSSSEGAQPSSSGRVHPSSSSGGPHRSGEAHPVSPGGICSSKLREAHPSRSREHHASNSADESSHAGEYFMLWLQTVTPAVSNQSSLVCF